MNASAAVAKTLSERFEIRKRVSPRQRSSSNPHDPASSQSPTAVRELEVANSFFERSLVAQLISMLLVLAGAVSALLLREPIALAAILVAYLIVESIRYRQRTKVAAEVRRLELRGIEAVELREDILASVTHDLQNPLAAILLSSSSIVSSQGVAATDPLARRQAQIIQSCAERMKRLIQDLLDFSKMEAGRFQVEPEHFEIGELCATLDQTFDDVARKKGIRFSLVSNVTRTQFTYDRQEITRAVSNLINNAMKFTPAGGSVKVRMNCSDHHLQIAVSDTGPGILPEHLPHLFDRYWQAKSTAHYGTGLGLAIVRGITQAHGGQVTVRSELGHGSEFTITLPV